MRATSLRDCIPHFKSNSVLEGFTAVYERGEQGWKVAACPEIPGVVSQGRTMEEA
jgi:hypothetical protein